MFKSIAITLALLSPTTQAAEPVEWLAPILSIILEDDQRCYAVEDRVSESGERSGVLVEVTCEVVTPIKPKLEY